MSTDLRNLSVAELKSIKRDNQQKLKKKYLKYKKKQTLIDDIKKIQKVREKINPNSKPKPVKIKTFEDYFQECIKNKTIPFIPHLIFAKLLSQHLRNMAKDL